MFNNAVHIASGFDNNFCAIASVMILSLSERSNPSRSYTINILNEDIEIKNKIILEEVISGFDNINLVFHDIAIDGLLDGLDFYESRHVNRASYFRLFMSKILKDVDKVLYIDPDTVIMSDVAELYDYNTEKTIVGACEVDLSDLEFVKKKSSRDQENFGDYHTLYDYFSSYMGFSDQSITEYLNAGVLLFNLDNIRKTYWNQLLNVFTENKFMFHDQDIINYVFKDDKLIVGCEWNFPNRLYVQRKSEKKPINILHAYSTDAGKPWFSFKTSGAHYFWITLRKTPFYEEVLCLHLLKKQSKAVPDDINGHIARINNSIKTINNKISKLMILNPLIKKINSIKLFFKI